MPSVISLRKYGVPKIHALLRRVGLATLNRPAGHYGLSLILGGTEGTLRDIANGYAKLAHAVTDYTRDRTSYEREDFKVVYDPAAEEGKSPDRIQEGSPLFPA